MILYPRHIVLGLFLGLFLACTGGRHSEDDQFEINTYLMLGNYYENEIGPLNEQFYAATSALRNSVEAFLGDPRESRVGGLRLDWEQAALAWDQLIFYDHHLVPSLDVANIRHWPIDQEGLELTLAGSAEIEPELIQSLPAAQQGLVALEYLLFVPGSEDQFLQLYTLDPLAQRRSAYLQALVFQLEGQAAVFRDAWEEHGYDFKTHTGTQPGKSLHRLYQATLLELDNMVRFKLQQPMGPGEGMEVPGLVQAKYSQRSLTLLRAQLHTLHRLLRGELGASPLRMGFDDLLRIKDRADLALAMELELGLAQEAADDLDGPLYEALTEEREEVDELLTALENLHDLMLTEIGPALDLSP